MNSKITFSVNQSKGAQNAFRIFINGELLDETETTLEKTYYHYDCDIVPGIPSNLVIQVLNHNSIVDDSQNVLSSNTIKIHEFFLKYKDYVSHNLNYSFNFVRDIDPVYQIYAKQNNIDYNKINLKQCTSVGKGLFHCPITLLKYWSPTLNNTKIAMITDILGLTDDEKESWYKVKDGHTIRKNFNVFDSTTQKFKLCQEKIIDQCIDRLLQYDSFNGEKCDLMYENPELVERVRINIQYALNFYEDR